MKLRTKLFKLFNTSAIALLLTACSGGSSSSTTNLNSAQIIDSEIEGISYFTQSQAGQTSSNGSFYYLPSDTSINFKIADIDLGSFNLSQLKNDKKVLVSEILGLDRSNVSDDNLKKLLRFLQSLDENNDPNDGIKISENTKKLITTDSNITNLSLLEISSIIANTGKTFISEEKALLHYENTLNNDFSISVDSVAPIFTSASSINVNENETQVITISTNDTSSVTYTLSGSDASYFTINSKAQLSFKSPVVYGQKNTYSLTINAKDSFNNTSSENITINVIKAGSVNPISKSYTIVDTDQTKCYDSTTGSEKSCSKNGYDADYIKNPPNYTKNSSGTIVTDNISGLMWTQSSDLDKDGQYSDVDDKRSYTDAITYCSELSLEGYNDWRLPDIKTLYSLILFTGEDPSGYMGSDTSGLKTFLSDSFTKAFGDSSQAERIIDGQYATSTKYVSTTMNADETMFGVNFVDGRIKGYPTKNKKYYVLCVRGNEAYGQNSFTNNGDKTISDSATGLMWQEEDSKSSNFENAISICENATIAGYTNWRLPNVKELHSLVDYTRSPDTTNSAAINPMFSSTSFKNEEGKDDWGYYWSSTSHVNTNNGSSAAYISFGRALGYMHGSILDVHGAGAQRSNSKQKENDSGASSQVGYNNETFYYKGPQGDILRMDNMLRCVRDDDSISKSSVTNPSEGFILFSSMGDTNTHLLDNNKNIVKTYTSSYKSAGSSYLSNSYTLLRAGIATKAKMGSFAQGGATGGIIEEIDSNNNVIWSYTSISDEATLHHDFKQIDENTTIALSWQIKNYNGSNYWNERVIKIDKRTNTIIWEWSAMDDGKLYPSTSKEDYLHFNSVDYKNGKILISARAKNSVYLIDESSKTIEKHFTANNTLDGQHDASFLDNGNILIFNNKTNSNTSSIVEIDMNDNIIWEYSNTFYSDHISGVQRLSNGNTLICSGTQGLFIEVNKDKEELWSYTNTLNTSKSNSVFKIRKYLQYQ